MSLFNRKPSSMKCVRCGVVNQFPVCENCPGDKGYTRGLLSDNTMGIWCNACKMGRTYVPCAQCGAQLPTESFR